MPNWKQTVNVADVFHREDMTVADKGVIIFARMRALRPEGEDLEFDNLLEEFADASATEQLGWVDQVWDAVYDWADAERVWIETRIF